MKVSSISMSTGDSRWRMLYFIASMAVYSSPSLQYPSYLPVLPHGHVMEAGGGYVIPSFHVISFFYSCKCKLDRISLGRYVQPCIPIS